jgi:hypothetical protein
MGNTHGIRIINDYEDDADNGSVIRRGQTDPHRRPSLFLFCEVHLNPSNFV